MNRLLLVALVGLALGCVPAATTSYSETSRRYETRLDLPVEMPGLMAGALSLLPTRLDSAGAVRFQIELRAAGLREEFGAEPELLLGLDDGTLDLRPARPVTTCPRTVPGCDGILERAFYHVEPADLVRMARSAAIHVGLRGPGRLYENALGRDRLGGLRLFVDRYVADREGHVPTLRVQMDCPRDDRPCRYWLVPDTTRSR